MSDKPVPFLQVTVPPPPEPTPLPGAGTPGELSYVTPPMQHEVPLPPPATTFAAPTQLPACETPNKCRFMANGPGTTAQWIPVYDRDGKLTNPYQPLNQQPMVCNTCGAQFIMWS